MELIGMTAFVLEQNKIVKERSIANFQHNTDKLKRIDSYAKFLTKIPEKGHFVPCDSEGNVLEKPKDDEQDVWLWTQYKQAKEKVLFEGFQLNGIEEDYYCVELIDTDNWIVFQGKQIVIENEFGQEIEIYTIEDLVKYNLTLTASAQKQIGCKR